MNIGILVQARMNSSRLPGKVLLEVNGKQLLEYTIERISLNNYNINPVIATSIAPTDDPIYKFCEARNIKCFRGSLDDVALRMLLASEYYKYDAFIRVNGDSPLLDPGIMSKLIDIYHDGNYDLVTNVFPRSFPVGQSIEIMNTLTFKNVYQKFTIGEELEHITKYFYNNSKEFRIYNYINAVDISNIRMVVDTKEDFDHFCEVIARLEKPHQKYSLTELVELYKPKK